MTEWRPIATAPLDGTSILVHNNYAPGLPGGVMEQCHAGNTAVAAWWGDSGESGEWICYMSLPRDPELHFEPTHWMPLPEPPGPESEQPETEKSSDPE